MKAEELKEMITKNKNFGCYFPVVLMVFIQKEKDEQTTISERKKEINIRVNFYCIFIIVLSIFSGWWHCINAKRIGVPLLAQ